MCAMASLRYIVTFTVLASSLSRIQGLNIRNGDTETLRWAPLTSLKTPFMTFTNDFNFPSWSTRHHMTKRNGRLYLQLAKGVPFSVVCGACFGRSSLKPNLTMEISDHHAISVPKRKGDRSLHYTEGVNECMMAYLITEPIKKGGVITCTLNRGKQVVKEKLTFDAVNVDIQEPPEEMEITSSKSHIELDCPKSEVSTSNPVMNVWHVEHKPSNKKQVGHPILSTKPKLSIKHPKHTITIMCSVYNIFEPSKVLQRRYKVHGVQSSTRSEYLPVSADMSNYDGMDEDVEILPPRISLSSSLLAIIIIAGVVCFLLALMGTYRFCSAMREK